LDVIGTLNIGPHTHVKLSGPSLGLIKIFGKFGQNWQKIGWVSSGAYSDKF